MNHGYLIPGHYDLVTPDGKITTLHTRQPTQMEVDVVIENISPAFVGFSIPLHLVDFNLKSTLAQIGLNTKANEIVLDPQHGRAQLRLTIYAMNNLAKEMLPFLEEGAFLGKLFAADDRRIVHNPDYLVRMFGRSDREGRPLLSLGGMQGSKQLTIEQIDGRLIAFLALREGKIDYDTTVHGFFPTLGRALKQQLPVRNLIRLHQRWIADVPRLVGEDHMLLVASEPLHIRTVFARVVDSLLPEGFAHTSANILQPDTEASGDIYELFGNSNKEIYDIPLEFFTLEPHREHVFFADRDQLQECLEDPVVIFKTFDNGPDPQDFRAATFIVKGSQMLELTGKDWIVCNPPLQSFPGIAHNQRQALLAERYIEQQPCYPFLQAIENGLITSQGVLFTRYFPSPLLKRMLLSYHVKAHLMGLYFQMPSRSHGEFFSQEDRAMLIDLVSCGTPVYWADRRTGMILQYLQRPGKSSGMFVPLAKRKLFLEATFFGLYGSNLNAGKFESELMLLFKGLLDMQSSLEHPLFNEQTSLALVTGGGPGVMEMGNRVAKALNILSCANIVDFEAQGTKGVVNEQKQNPFVEAKMTYRLDHLVERQAEFYLDFPIFVTGGIGTDFEFSLEEVRHKVGARPNGPILLFGPPEYWSKKITSRFQTNLETGTIKGSEWVSNSFFCVETAQQALKLYKDFFTGKLNIGKKGPVFKEGFVVYK
ncbi:MAG: hypothetical protein JSS62_01960 [Verrucomicrobia bacterium]|nr:hypothetical protein [Verrucomicrobiota bacterium]MBS0645583.1 hypothetical protein [Verrucomicrobiota bacterium]